MKKFLITTLDGEEPFFTDYFNAENHFNPDIGMTIYNLIAGTYTTWCVTPNWLRLWASVPVRHRLPCPAS